MAARPVSLALALALAAPALARPVTLTPVGNPVPGVGPVGLGVAETRVGTYVVVADHQGNTVRSFGIDRTTGALTPAGSAAAPDGPSAVAVSRAGRYVVVAGLRSNDVSVFSLDASSGALARVGSPVPSGGSGPVALDVGDDGFVVVANKDSDQLGVLRLNLATGALVSVGSHAVGSGPADVKVAGGRVLVGHALSNDVHLLSLDRYGNLLPVDAKPVGARVTSVVVGPHGHLAAAGTYPNGDVHGFLVGHRGLTPLGATATGGDLTDLALSDRGTLFATGITPARVGAFDLTRHGLTLSGNLAMTGLSSRTLATVQGRHGTFVIVNEYNNNQTVVLQAR
jgi:DNA-binding beta-propeller fold protein YncE